MAELVFLRRGEEVMRYQLDGMITTIGRGGRNDIAFPEHEPYISREHASVEKRGGGFWLRDLSHDGILLDGLSVKEGLLRDGALFSLGKWQVRFQAKSAGMEIGTLTRGGGTLPVFDRDQHSEAGKAFLCFDLDGERIERPFTSSALTIGSSPNNDLRLSMPYIELSLSDLPTRWTLLLARFGEQERFVDQRLAHHRRGDSRRGGAVSRQVSDAICDPKRVAKRRVSGICGDH